ncbi:helix-turn-helix domain-containing protein [Saccharibacter sp. 17.LH.SD]|uniref:GlxA family transcriptional regulator n=1 Tax=Saccharibacter sp. 17.LH.SD TaxID=2689393 RepID=UPI001371E885|nr:helix-turn-helix domain-containing protein [Saccharibacter sp. 17.LH.SD]MXV44934.1 helix-turn-helix domain-containing protein [Saccharibacter sp. 17.LH.SD]
MRHHSLPSTAKRIGILALPYVQLLDIAGPMDVFTEANTQAKRILYELHVISTSSAPLHSSSGLIFHPTTTISSPLDVPFDTLLIAGAPHLNPKHLSPDLLKWVGQHAPRCRRFGSICTGALVLAAAGLLTQRRVTTHWAVAEQLSQQFPSIQVEADSLFICDGPVCTAAGVTAGLDLAIALVDHDFGRDLARKVSNQLVMFFRRPGGQLQFSHRGIANPMGRSILRTVQRRVLSKPHLPSDTRALAELAGLSPRHFARLFHKEIGLSPALWVERVRMDTACRTLEEGLPPKQVAAMVGFKDVDTFRRAFQRQFKTTPAEYRRRHAAQPPTETD